MHFLQIWVLPWKKGLKPTYHTESFTEEKKRKGLVTIVSPVKGGGNATGKDEAAAEGTIPIHADFWFGAGISEPRATFSWTVAGGSGIARFKRARKAYVYLPNAKDGRAKVRLNRSEVLGEGDGA